MPDARFQETLAHLHLLAVLPALEDLVRLSPEAREVARRLTFPLRLRLRGGPQTCLLPDAGGFLRVGSHKPDRAALNLTFLTPRQLNKTFLGKPALPPAPTGAVWHLIRIKVFTD